MWSEYCSDKRRLQPLKSVGGSGLIGFGLLHPFRQREGGPARSRLPALAVYLTIPIAVVLRLLSPLLVLLLLNLRGGHDAIIMLGVLQIILGGHAITLSIRIASQLQILLVNMRGGTANFYFRPVRIEGPVLVVMLAAAMSVLRPTAALS